MVTTKICQMLSTNALQSTEYFMNDAPYPNCNINPEEEIMKEGMYIENPV